MFPLNKDNELGKKQESPLNRKINYEVSRLRSQLINIGGCLSKSQLLSVIKRLLEHTKAPLNQFYHCVGRRYRQPQVFLSKGYMYGTSIVINCPPLLNHPSLIKALQLVYEQALQTTHCQDLFLYWIDSTHRFDLICSSRIPNYLYAPLNTKID